jgi:hypothetical protein
MRFAFLILVHHQSESLLRLINRLEHPDTVFFVHVDAKADAAQFRKALGSRADVTLLPQQKRASINWGGFGIIEATLSLMSAAHVAGADRFVLLSGADYPVRPVADILHEVAKDQELIAVDRLCRRDGTGWFDQVAYQRYIGYIPWLNPRTGRPRLTRWADKVISRLPRRKSPFPIYYGPAWYSLTRAAVTEILTIASEQPNVIDWFRHTRSPDEMLMQTILKGSSRANAIVYDATVPGSATRPDDLAATVYADFEADSSAPRTIDLTDLPKIEELGALFARKIDPVISSDLLAAIDEKYHGITSSAI